MTDIFIDFETYYDTEITLKKMNYSEYVRKTDVQLLGVFHNNQLHTLEPDDIKPFIAEIDWTNTTIIGHNLLFDALVLKHFYGKVASNYRDTLGMSRAIYPCSKHDLANMARMLDCPIKKGELKTKGRRQPDLQELKTYCAQDVLITHFLDAHLAPQMARTELQVIDHTIKLWLNPTLRVNKPLLQNTLAEEKTAQEIAIKATGLTKEQIRSDAKFAQYLQSLGYEPPTKWSLKQNKEVFAFAKSDTQWQEFCQDHEEIQSLLELKSSVNSNIKESRAERILLSLTPDNRLPIAYNYHGAFTGRFSGANKANAQNFNRGGTIRKCIEAPPNHTLIVSDLSQIEARVLAWLADETKLLDIFRQGGDIYCQVGSQIFGRPINKTDHPELRRLAKNMVLGLGYGMSAPKFQIYNKLQNNPLTEDYCYELVNLYRSTFPRIPLLWNLFQNHIPYFHSEHPIEIAHIKIQDYHITLPSSRRLHYEGLHYDVDERTWRLKNRKKIYGALVVENIVQAIARDVFVEKMMSIPGVVMHSHDELVVPSMEIFAEESKNMVHTLMTHPVSWAPEIPINAETTIARIYGDAK